MANVSHKQRVLLAAVAALVCLGIGLLVFGKTVAEPVAASASNEEWPNALALAESQTTTAPTTTSPPTTFPVTTVAPTSTTGPAPIFDGSTGYVAKALIEEGTVEVWTEPDVAAAPAWSLAVPTEFFGPRYFQVIGESGDWFEVAVPVRPNGTTGWIPKDAVAVSEVDTRIRIDLSDRQLTVERAGADVMQVPVAIGKSGSPTPTGSFYLRDELEWDEASVYGPYVLALSAFSETIDRINGGDAVVAIHGTRRPDLLGTAASLGCIRVENDSIRAVAAVIEPGTPVEIVS